MQLEYKQLLKPAEQCTSVYKIEVHSQNNKGRPSYCNQRDEAIVNPQHKVADGRVIMRSALQKTHIL